MPDYDCPACGSPMLPYAGVPLAPGGRMSVPYMPACPAFHRTTVKFHRPKHPEASGQKGGMPVAAGPGTPPGRQPAVPRVRPYKQTLPWEACQEESPASPRRGPPSPHPHPPCMNQSARTAPGRTRSGAAGR